MAVEINENASRIRFPSTAYCGSDDLMDRMPLGFPARYLWRRSPDDSLGWNPAIEMHEKDTYYMVRAELPGVKKEDVNISVSGDTLNIKGERQECNEAKKDEYHFCELMYGPFSRSLSVPEDVDKDKISAEFRDGMMEITLPKSAKSMPKKTDIKIK